MRRFAWISAYRHETLLLPRRQTAASAAYDLALVARTVLPPGQAVLAPTGLKVYMPADELFLVSLRSSLALKRGLLLMNGVGIIDADYADNPDNEGHLQLILYNTATKEVVLERGERIAQGIFLRYLSVDGEAAPSKERMGGFGSTTREERESTE